MPASIFADEWRDCLRAHYTYVIRTSDKITERTLRGVMIHEAGFTDAELKELAVLATAHVDDVPADFVPDLEILQEAPPAIVSVAVAMPEQVIQAMVVEDALERDAQADAVSAEAFDAADVEIEGALDDDDTVMLMDDALDDDDESDEPLDEDQPEDDPLPPDPDVTQLSLF